MKERTMESATDMQSLHKRKLLMRGAIGIGVIALISAIIFATGSTTLSHEPVSISTGTSLSASVLDNHQCIIENRFDFVGNDIGTASSKSVEECCGICMSTPNCTAFSWTNFEKGTCFLKSARGKVVYNPNVRSALVYSSSSPSSSSTVSCPQLQQGIDYIGFDIGTHLASDASDCCDACREFPGCRFFSWTNFMDGTCWLKSHKGKTVANPLVQSGKVYPDPIEPTCGLQYGIDFEGYDIGNRSSTEPEACCGFCKETKHCRAFSWTTFNGGTCWLKRFQGNIIENPIAISSIVYENPLPFPTTCTLEKSIDFLRNDIGNVSSDSFEECCDICKMTPHCHAFTWSEWNHGTCFLKATKSTAVNVKEIDIVSGTFSS